MELRKKVSLFFLAIGVCFFAQTAFSFATTTCEGAFTLKNGVCIPNATGLPNKTISSLLVNFLMWLLYIFGTVAVIAFVVSGFLYVTSAGNDSMIDRAKTYMTWSVVGIIVAFSGVIIINAISTFFSGGTKF